MSDNLKPILDRLFSLKPSLYQKDFLLTWQRSNDDLNATLLVAQALEELYKANISTRVFNGGIAVSNFIGPRWFSNGAGPYDYLGNLKAPWQMTPGGYLIKRNAGVVTQVFGESYPDWKRDGKNHGASRTKRRSVKVCPK